MMRSAVIDETGRYRYRLKRVWHTGGRVTFVMLNPSTADGFEDDPTVRKCIGFAQRLSCGELRIVNLFAYRATDPKELAGKSLAELVGPQNQMHVEDCVLGASFVFAAWGSSVPQEHREFAQQFQRWLVSFVDRRNCAPVHHLGLNRDGMPRHSLMTSYTVPRGTFEMPSQNTVEQDT